MTHPKDLLYDYAMQLLEPDIQGAVAKHLDMCETCQAEVTALQEAVVFLSESVEQQASPDDLWEKIDRQLATETQRSTETPELASPQPSFEAWLKPLRQPFALASIVMLALTIGSSFWGLQSSRSAQQTQGLVREFLAFDGVEKIQLKDNAGESLGNVFVTSDDRALFVLEDSAAGRTYQAWGHSSDDWSADSNERLTSLALNQSGIFEVSTAGFASLYLSLEPKGGSDQPTLALSHISLLDPIVTEPLSIIQPQDGAILSSPLTIISGLVDSNTQTLSYQLNGAAVTESSFAGTKFTFTLTGLQEGENQLRILVVDQSGKQTEETLRLIYKP